MNNKAADVSTKPGFAQAFLLLVTSGLTVLVTAIIGPSLPAMQAHFRDVPGADFLVPLTLSAPWLSMALTSVIVGELADRWGRKRLLIMASIVYGLVGTMPLYLDSLAAVLASRFALGALEAVLQTVSTALIGDHYQGRQRERYISLQTAVTSIAAVVFTLLGGLLADHGWRAPYAVFAVGLLLAPLMAVFLREPQTRATMTATQRQADSQVFDARGLAARCVLALVLGLEFLILGAHFGYLLTSAGVGSAPQIGVAYAIYSIGMIVGNMLFGWVIASTLSIPIGLGIGSVVGGVALGVIPLAGGFSSLSATGFAFGVGMGILLPAMVTWNIRELPMSRRGFGIGAFNSLLCLGMFLSPMVVVGLERVIGGSRASAVAIEGYALVLLGVVSILVGLSRAQASRAQTSRARAVTTSR